MVSVTELRKHLTQECTRKGNPPAEEGMNSDTEEDSVFETRFVENFDLSQFPNWKQCFNEEKNTSHLFYFGGKSIGYSQIEIIISRQSFDNSPRGNGKKDQLRVGECFTASEFNSRFSSAFSHHSVPGSMPWLPI